MLERHAPAFAALSPECAHHVAEAMTARYHLPEVPDASSGYQLLSFCEEVALDQASVVLSLARDATPLGVACIETLVGRPIVRLAAPEERRAPRGAARRREDNRVVLAVAANPKRPGSAAHARFALWRVGMTVTEALWLGLRPDDIRHDTERGYVTLGKPDDGQD